MKKTIGIRIGGSASQRVVLVFLVPAVLVAACVDLKVERDGTERSARGLEVPAPTDAQVESARANAERKRDELAEEGPMAFDRPGEAQEFFVRQRLRPGESSLPIEHLRSELDALRLREAAALTVTPPPRRPGDVRGWSALGPGNVGGRTRAIVIDPNAPEVMYAAGVAGGVWKSTDGGASFVACDDSMLNLAVCCLAMDPEDSSVIYAGTGEGWYFADVFVRGLGIFKTTDAGATWTQLPGTVSGVPAGAFDYVNDVVISPNDSNRLYAATRTGVWRSLDAGESWSVVLSNPEYIATPPTTNGSVVGCTDLVVRADKSPDVLFAAFGSSEADGLFRSLTGGNTWQPYGVSSNQGRMSIALAPSDNDVMYILMADNGSGAPLGQLVNVFRSVDGGNSFTAQVDFGSLTGPWLLSNLILATGCIPGGVYSQGWYDNVIAVDPIDPDIVWVGGVDLFRSVDGGQNFEIAGYSIFYQSVPLPPYYIHPDNHAIVFHPQYDGTSNQTMYVGNDGGVFRTQNARAATSLEDCPLPPDQPLPAIVWQNLNNGYAVTQFYHGDSARDSDVYIGGCQDNGTNRVQAANTPNDWELVFGGDGGYVAIDPTNSQVVYVEYHVFPSFQKSTNGGDSFVAASNGITDTDGIFITPFAMDELHPNVLWTGGRRPWRTLNGASSWHVAGPDFAGPAQISAIAVAPSNGNVVYLGFTNGYVARSTNALNASPTWSIFTNGLVGSWVSSLAVDPVDPNVAYCTYSNYGVPHVLRTVNGGLSWSSIDGIAFDGVPDIPVHWIAVRPCNREQLYAATELGVFASDDQGTTWQPVNAGLPHTVVESLDFQDENTLVAFTHGRGAFLARLDACSLEKRVPVRRP